MTLLVDIGNTRTKYIESKGLGTLTPKSKANSAVTIQWLEAHWACYDSLIISSVSNKHIIELIVLWAKGNNISIKLIESEASRFGLISNYQSPEQLGVDRWLAMLGAISVYPDKNLLIVDSGTATTLDIVDSNGQHCGGWIVPGIEMMFTSLLANTSKISAEFEEDPSIGFGDSTTSNVNHGCWATSVALIALALRESDKLKRKVDNIILMGGNGTKLQGLLERESIVNNELIFHGLQRYNVN